MYRGVPYKTDFQYWLKISIKFLKILAKHRLTLVYISNKIIKFDYKYINWMNSFFGRETGTYIEAMKVPPLLKSKIFQTFCLHML